MRGIRSLLLLAATLASVTTYAADYYVVVPVKGRTANVADIGVALTPLTLPLSGVGQAYRYDFNALLQVTGDPSYSGTGVSWDVVAGALPAGLNLSSTGVLSGTPTALGNSSFTLRASYRTQNGLQTYDLAVLQPVVASGGTVTTNGDYVIHTFTGNGTFQLTSPSSVRANVLVVGGGGGGGFDGAGGGGGGAVLYQANYTLTAGSYSVVVGAGGKPGTGSIANTLNGAAGLSGSPSAFGSLTAAGGGGGGGKLGIGLEGSSGGGNGHRGGDVGGTATAGYPGGGASAFSGGGGGGAGGPGTAGVNDAGHGGAGQLVNLPGLASMKLGCGGGGGTYIAAAVGLACGGSVSTSGTGGNRAQAPKAGAPNTGGGGGGGGGYAVTGFSSGAAGGSGVVIVTYSKAI